MCIDYRSPKDPSETVMIVPCQLGPLGRFCPNLQTDYERPIDVTFERTETQKGESSRGHRRSSSSKTMDLSDVLSGKHSARSGKSGKSRSSTKSKSKPEVVFHHNVGYRQNVHPAVPQPPRDESHPSTFALPAAPASQSFSHHFTPAPSEIRDDDISSRRRGKRPESQQYEDLHKTSNHSSSTIRGGSRGSEQPRPRSPGAHSDTSCRNTTSHKPSSSRHETLPPLLISETAPLHKRSPSGTTTRSAIGGRDKSGSVYDSPHDSVLGGRSHRNSQASERTDDSNPRNRYRPARRPSFAPSTHSESTRLAHIRETQDILTGASAPVHQPRVIPRTPYAESIAESQTTSRQGSGNRGSTSETTWDPADRRSYPSGHRPTSRVNETPTAPASSSHRRRSSPIGLDERRPARDTDSQRSDFSSRTLRDMNRRLEDAERHIRMSSSRSRRDDTSRRDDSSRR